MPGREREELVKPDRLGDGVHERWLPFPYFGATGSWVTVPRCHGATLIRLCVFCLSNGGLCC